MYEAAAAFNLNFPSEFTLKENSVLAALELRNVM